MDRDPDASQLQLQLPEQQPMVFRKPVQAIHIAISGGIQNKTQRLAFNAMLKHALEVQAKNPDKSIDTYVISRTKLMRTIDYTSPNRKHLKETLVQMQTLKVQWDFLRQDNEATWLSCVLLPVVGFDNDHVIYSYAPQIKPLLFNSKIYAWLDLSIQRKMRLDASAALYEWVNRFRKVPSKLTNEMRWEDWRLVIYGEVSETSALREYKIFKREKLKPALAEINAESDLEVELIEKKDGGRSVKYLQFLVKEKPLFVTEGDAERDTADLERRLGEFGLSGREVKRMLQRYTPEKIGAHLQFTVDRVNDTNQKPIRSPIAYLKRALEGNYVPEPKPALPAPAPNANDSMKSIQEAFARERADEAAAMFAEMPETDQQGLVDKYNGLQTVEGMKVPPAGSKRLARHMIPFYGWLAVDTWGEPTSQEIFDFAIKSGMIRVEAKAA